MILGIGTDVVAVNRFSRWGHYTHRQLQKVFSKQEIFDCCNQTATVLKASSYTEQRLAARFAAKEAFYKALNGVMLSLNIMPKQQISFLFVCKQVQVLGDLFGRPIFDINWNPLIDKIGYAMPPVIIHLSLTHEKSVALAFVIISEK